MVDRVLGVYNADGGLVGELRYIVGHVLGTVSCALCDITHSPLRRKREWDELVLGLGMRVDLRHLNELTEPEALAAVGRAPVVLADRNGMLEVLLDAVQLEALDGSVAGFGAALKAALDDLSRQPSPRP